MSRKIRKAVASTLALAMMAGNVSSMPAGQIASIVQAAAAGATVSINAPASVKAGETFTVTCDVTDNADGFSALVAWVNYNKDVFELVSWEHGSEDKKSKVVQNIEPPAENYHNDTKDANINSIVQLYFDGKLKNLTGDVTLSKITFKVADNAASGTYKLDVDGDADTTKATQNRIVDGNIVECAANYKDAEIVVQGTGTAEPTAAPTTAPTTTPTTAPTTAPTATPATPDSGSLSAKVADATGKTGDTIKAALTVSGSVAGFTADLSFDTSALELTGATASGYDVEVNGTKIVALANPYQDNASATVNLEFKAKSAGSHKVEVKALEGATKGEKVLTGTGTAGTITVSGDAQQPETPPASSDAMQIVIGEVKGKAGDTVSVPIYAKNVGAGFSTVQFTYDMDSSFEIDDVYSGDFGGQWTLGTKNKKLQFLTGNGNNITEDGQIGEIDVIIPDGTSDGVYEFKLSGFEGSSYDKASDKQLTLASGAFAGVAGKIIIGDAVVDPTAAPTVAPTTTPSTPTTAPTAAPTSDPGKTDGIQIELGTIKGAAGDTVSVPVYAKNVGTGFSTVQFAYDMDSSFEIDDVYSGDFGGQWTVGTKNKKLQFLTGNGNNITEDGQIGEIDVIVPAGTADGVYEIKLSNFEGSSYDKATDKQLTLNASAFSGVNGKIVIGDVSVDPTTAPTDKPVDPTVAPTTEPTKTPSNPTVAPTDSNLDKPAEQPVDKGQLPDGIDGPTVDAGKYTVEKAGDEFTMQIKVSDNADGFNALIAWLDIDTNVFEFVEWAAGDPTDPNYKKSTMKKNLELTEYKKPGSSDLLTLINFYFDSQGKNYTGDAVFATITLKVKDGVKDGYYVIPFDAVGDEGRAMCNRMVEKDGKGVPVVLNPTYKGAVVQVGNPTPGETPTSKPTTVPTEKPDDKPTTAPTSKPDDKTDGIQIEIGEVKGKAGETVSVPIYAKNVGTGFSTVQFTYSMDSSFEIDDVYSGDFGGQWTVGTKNKKLQFLTGNGNNITEDGQIGEIDVIIPDGTADGVYEIKLSDFEGSSYDKATDKQLTLDSSAFSGVTGKIVIGDVVSVDPTDKPDDKPTTAPTEKPDDKPTTAPTEKPTTAPTKTPDDKTDGIQIVIGEVKGNPGETVSVPIYAKNVGTGFSTVQFTYEMDGKLTIDDVYSGDFGGQWTVGSKNKKLQFLTGNGNNITEDGLIGEIDIVIPEDMAGGEYLIKLTDFEGSSYDKATDKQLTLDSSAFAGVTGKITISGSTDPVPTTPPVNDDDYDYDVDGNGTVNTRDLLKLKQYLLLVVDKSEVPGGDINKDGDINSMDMIRLVKKLLAK